MAVPYSLRSVFRTLHCVMGILVVRCQRVRFVFIECVD